MKQPVAYLRKSRVTSDSTLSWDVQEAKVRALAAEHGETGLLLLSDWNRSGRKGADGRPGYRRLLAMIDAGEVSAVYSYSLSRLSRSLSDFASLVERCQAAHVPIRLHVERHLDFGTATGRLNVNILASFAQMEAEIAQERARDTAAERRNRGEKLGPVNYGDRPGEDVALVVDAFGRAGSVNGAARLLNVEGRAKTRRSGPWSATSVRSILWRLDALPRNGRMGVKPAAPFLFYRLLRCPSCHRFLTGVRYRNGSNPAYVSYRCLQGRTTPGHGPQSIPETRVLPWVKTELARLMLPATADTPEEGTKRDALLARRRLVVDTYVDGKIDKAERDRRLLDIDTDIDRLDAATRVESVPEIDWSWTPETLNRVLRDILVAIDLDSAMRGPVSAEWIDPSLRAD